MKHDNAISNIKSLKEGLNGELASMQRLAWRYYSEIPSGLTAKWFCAT
ncbi:MAG: hypothetical protein IPI97_08840 [Nitrosomonas sp.]|nr:hypothetical protein [Nitrosomonas sp.]MBK7365081.1 hypothetical protein [Nitrosomonas sp.]